MKTTAQEAFLLWWVLGRRLKVGNILSAAYLDQSQERVIYTATSTSFHAALIHGTISKNGELLQRQNIKSKSSTKFMIKMIYSKFSTVYFMMHTAKYAFLQKFKSNSLCPLDYSKYTIQNRDYYLAGSKIKNYKRRGCCCDKCVRRIECVKWIWIA